MQNRHPEQAEEAIMSNVTDITDTAEISVSYTHLTLPTNREV